MTKQHLMQAVQQAKAETRQVLQAIYDSLNYGQQKKLQKDEKALRILQQYEVLL